MVWCARNLLTGATARLTDPGNVVQLGFQGQALISPDGSEAYLAGTADLSAFNPEVELYGVKTDGSGLRRITSSCIAMDSATSMRWQPVRLSPDGKRMLANCHTEHFPPAPVVRTDKIMIVHLDDGSACFVTHGRAYDWHVPTT
ncbi:hypothetical protein [Frateuria sp. STR12]|uniref:hypothetical protein n=1 Tax=Frateuria hangzhouensis TaxID=2995589 RepID=UPI002260BA07|nr:hypothetical protein [Frateuria sp. STR12]MCX7514908.1 hypothetical protein [Frateuria sp. STR12]